MKTEKRIARSEMNMNVYPHSKLIKEIERNTKFNIRPKLCHIRLIKFGVPLYFLNLYFVRHRHHFLQIDKNSTRRILGFRDRKLCRERTGSIPVPRCRDVKSDDDRLLMGDSPRSGHFLLQI